MKRVCSAILVLTMLSACTAQQLYRIPTNKTSTDFRQDREECTAVSGYTGGHFLFGPIIIIFPIAILLAVIEMNRQKDFEKCMVNRGYACTEGCWNVPPSTADLKSDKIEHSKRQEAEKPASIPLKESTEVDMRARPSVSTANETRRDGHFIAYNDGTVLDTNTNLMWAAKDNDAGITWQEAKKYCENYRGGGYSDWRMPAHSELETLLDSQIDGINGCNLTRLIELTKCSSWALERDYGAYFRFDGGGREWTLRPFNFFSYRALPVRSAK